MRFVYDPRLLDYMERKKKNKIVVEVISSASSDFDVTELHVHLVDDKRAAFFKKQKQYHGIPTEEGEVLLPNYVLEYKDVVTFRLKKFLFIPYIVQEGIRL